MTPPLFNISISPYNTTLLRPLRSLRSTHRGPVLRHLHPLSALIRIRLGRAGRSKVLRRRITAVVHGRWLGPAAVCALLVGRAGAVRVLRRVEGEVILGGLAVAFALLPGDEELPNNCQQWCTLEKYIYKMQDKQRIDEDVPGGMRAVVCQP